MAEVPLVLVTGISGFIGSWVGYTALKLGYRVRGTVRSLSNPKKTQHLKELCPGAAHELELVEADLTSEKGWDEAVKGCQYILHVASPFPLKAPKDKYELIKPAVDGTLFVLQAASRLPVPPRRVVITSSVASIMYGHDDSTKVLTDETWSILDDPKHHVGAYGESKTLAEKAAWDFLASLPEEKKFELATVNPSLVLGPLLSSSDCSSVEFVSKILMAEYPALPNIYVDMVSVFDVAKVHLLAMTHPEAAGKRFMVHGVAKTLPEVSDILVAEFSSKGYKPTTMRVSRWVLYFASFFDDSTKNLLPQVGLKRNLQPKNVQSILGINLDSDASHLVKMIAYGAINAGLIPDKSPDNSITSSYVRPDIDLTGVPMAERL